ncbi:aminotransferase class V-fold PLP-dependent enzyme [Frankia sp. Cj3]|uniref:aminotransferase class V-fold PLP-dependent enzyme n=1 Tax=Frankia sp. Cj3 TaxID=2880976 RepID=UPI001EF50A61|nr:aminotransferase class V-fold PLP-dependent enzyme [Frankia sp. Cj3]
MRLPGLPATPFERLAARWQAARDSSEIIHLDAAGCARMSRATIAATGAYLAEESRAGGYVAEIRHSEPLAQLRADLANLLGPDLSAGDVAFHHSASTAFAALVDAWPLPAGGRIGVVPGEFGSNAMVLAARAARDGIDLIDLPVDGYGRIDLDALDRHGPAGLDLDLVTFPHVPSQRGIVQPAAEVAARATAAGVPLLLDVAQSLGHVPTVGLGAAAYVGTSRKWLCGPRGVGVLAISEQIIERLVAPARCLHTASWDGHGPPVPLTGIAALGIGESAAAARVGLARAVGELVDAGTAAVSGRIAALGTLARRRLDGVAGWRVGEPLAEPSGIVTLVPPPGVDPHAVRDRLYAEAGILTSAFATSRAPREMTGPLLRASPHVYSDPAEIEALADALDRFTRTR